MPLDFPSSPTNGQEYNGYVYSTYVGAWQAKPSAQSPFYTSDTPPANPVKGDSWFNTNDGTMYIYTYDGNTYQWVEHRSQIARSQVGMTPIVPTSVILDAGTATIASSGEITFSGASKVSLDNLFTTTYKNYRFIAKVTSGTTAAGMYWKMRNAGVDDSNANYISWGFYTDYNGSANESNMRVVNGTSGSYSYTYAGDGKLIDMDFYEPKLAAVTRMYGKFVQGGTFVNAAGFYNAATSFDGWAIGFPNATSGTIRFYGYN